MLNVFHKNWVRESRSQTPVPQVEIQKRPLNPAALRGSYQLMAPARAHTLNKNTLGLAAPGSLRLTAVGPFRPAVMNGAALRSKARVSRARRLRRIAWRDLAGKPAYSMVDECLPSLPWKTKADRTRLRQVAAKRRFALPPPWESIIVDVGRGCAAHGASSDRGDSPLSCFGTHRQSPLAHSQRLVGA